MACCKSYRFALIIVIFLFLATPHHLNAQAKYAIADLATPADLKTPSVDFTWFSGGYHCQVINNKGDVLLFDKANPRRLYLYSKGIFHDLGWPPDSIAVTSVFLNDHGQVILSTNSGRSVHRGQDYQILYHLYAYRDGRYIEINSLGGPHIRAQGFNNKGDIVGISQDADWHTHGFLYHDGVMKDLGDLWPSGINDAGDMVAFDLATFAVVIVKGGTATSLGDPPGMVDPQAINNADQVIGELLAPVYHVALNTNGQWSDISTDKVGFSSVYGMNNLGQVVGFSDPDPSHTQDPEVRAAFVYLDGKWQNLNDLIPADSGWQLTVATGINDQGQIVGDGIYKGQSRVFVLTPNSHLGSDKLKLTDDQGHEAKGIVCDNLRGMKENLLDRLYVKLPPEFASATVEGVVTDAGGHTEDPHNRNLGHVESGTGQLIYYPPDEFNEQQEPSDISQITKQATRSVYLNVTFTMGDTRYSVDRKEIVLARPPVILVHGINSNPCTWDGNPDAGQIGLGKTLDGYGFRTGRVHHGYDDLADSRKPGVGAEFFKGNGPVEIAATNLRDTIESVLNTTRTADGLAVRRADIVAHSYGGVITRWYLRTNGTDRLLNNRSWYTNSSNVPDGDSLYYLKNGFMDYSYPSAPANYAAKPDIRKVITLASMWRGVPLCNYVNETRYPVNTIDLYHAPFGIDDFLGNFIDGVLSLKIPTKVPSMEVMAINSPWLSYLTSTNPPFLDDVAYGAVGGDNNAYLYIGDPYTLIHRLQVPSWFPYLGMERCAGRVENYSDGLVPVWSASIPASPDFDSSLMVSATHDSIIWNDRAKAAAICWLSHAKLPKGSELNTHWNAPISSRIDKIWTFRPGEMAPHVQNDVYQRVGGVGRINPIALREINSAVPSRIGSTGAIISWVTATESDSKVSVNKAGIGGVKEVYVPGLTKVHNVWVTGLEPNTTYSFKVESKFDDSPDGFFVLKSGAAKFKTTSTDKPDIFISLVASDPSAGAFRLKVINLGGTARNFTVVALTFNVAGYQFTFTTPSSIPELGPPQTLDVTYTRGADTPSLLVRVKYQYRDTQGNFVTGSSSWFRLK